MEEAQEILLNSLENSGVSLPIGVSSTQNLTPFALFSICSQSLHLINDSLSFPPSFPDPMAERFKICTEIASAIKNMGYRGDISFHQFLYPSEEDSFKLVRFLVERLSERSVDRKVADDQGSYLNYQTVRTRLEELKLKIGVSDSSDTKATSIEDAKESTEDLQDSKINDLEDGESLPQKNILQIRSEIEDLRRKEKILLEGVAAKALEAQHKLLKAAGEMDFDVDFHIEELKKQVETRRQNLVELELQWDTFRKTLEEKKISLEGSLCAKDPEGQEKHQKAKELELETKSILSEIRKREEERSRLSAELKNQPKVASRKSYVQRITEITKNSRKQDADIERILQETRELQMESNSIQDRLQRTYAVVDETVIRDAKKDPVRRQVHRLLTGIHESFEQISEKILKTDRTRREVAELEAKIAAMTPRSLNIEKLQSDLDAIKRENEFLEKRLKNDKIL